MIFSMLPFEEFQWGFYRLGGETVKLNTKGPVSHLYQI